MGISTHVLDTARGRPAAGILVELAQRTTTSPNWSTIATATTNADGRAVLIDTIPAGTQLQLRFSTGPYLAAANATATSGSGTIPEPFFPEASIVFAPRATDSHLHVPLLLSDFGYSTYRGS